MARWHKAWHSLSFSLPPHFFSSSFEPCVCVKRSVYTRTVYVWLCVSRTTQWHEKDPAPCLRAFTLGFRSGRRAGRRGLFVFTSLPFVVFFLSVSSVRSPSRPLSHPLKLIHIVRFAPRSAKDQSAAPIGQELCGQKSDWLRWK